MRRAVPALQLAARAAIAASLSLLAAQGLALPHPIYAMIGAVIVTDLDPAKTRALTIPRMTGTALGAVLGAILLPIVGTGVWSVALGIFIAMLACQAAGKKDAAKLAGYVCALVLMEHGDEAWTYAAYRFAETFVGVAMAVLVSLVPKLLNETDPPEVT